MQVLCFLLCPLIQEYFSAELLLNDAFIHVQGRENAYTGVPTPLSMPGVEIASKTPVDLSSNVVSVLSAKNTY